MNESFFTRWLGWLLAWLLIAGVGAAQAQTYAYRNDVFSYDTPSAAAQTVTWHTTNASACSGYPNGDDDYADITFASATNPANDFTFTFAGTAYSGVRIYSNGMLAFGADNSGLWRDYTNSALPINTAVSAYSTGCPGGIPARTLVAYWTDIVAGTANNTSGASIRYELLGTAPNRRFVISWVNVKLYNQTARYNFQVILYESPAGGLNSNFKYQYTTGSSTGSAATVGVQVSATDFTQYSYNQAFIDPTVGSAVLWYPANQLQGKQAEYRLDEGLWNGTPGEIKDTSTGAYDAVRVGAAASTGNGKVCRGGSIPSNTSNATIDAIATPVAPAAAGSVDFWYYSNVKWNNSGSDAMLVDATATAARPFYLMRQASGALKFVVTDSAGTSLTVSAPAQSFAAGTWHHVGVSWNLRPGSNQTVLQIFLDGALVSSLRSTSNGSIAALNTLYVGDNRTAGVTPSGGTPNSANAVIDEINFYNIEINANQANADKNATRTSCLAFDHFHIVHGGSLVNCGNATANITFEAHDSAHGLIALSGNVASLSTSTGHGSWITVAGGSINPAVDLGGGNGSYTFSNESSVTLGLQNTYVETLNINITAGVYTEHSGAAASCGSQDYTFGSICDADISFDAAGFRIVDGAGNAVGSQVAGITSGTYYLQAVKSSCATPGACAGVCTSLFPAGTAVNLDLAFECSNPTACQPGQAVTITPGSGAGAAGSIAGNGSGTISATTGSYSSRSLTFNAVAPSPTTAVPFTLSYPDVGRIRLWARYPAGATSPSVAGSSAPFVVAPHHFGLSGIPAAPLVAGKVFAATVTAYNGNNAATPNFGQESVAETAILSASQCQPTGSAAAAGSLATYTVGSFNNGAAAVSGLAWSEVGNIDLTATLASGSYLGSGLTATGNTGSGGSLCSGSGGAGNVGRFIPDHFTTTVTPSCGAFTYSGQALPVMVTAWNGAATPAVTRNYDGTANTSPTFAKAVTLVARDAADTANNPGPGGWLAGSSAVAASAFAAGVAQGVPTYAFTTAPTAPTIVRVRATDTDNVTSALSTEGSTTLYSGRLWLGNAYGIEFLPLVVPAQVQYWVANAWRQNLADSCTQLNVPTAANAGLKFYAPPVTARNALVSGAVVAQINGNTAATRQSVSGGDVKLLLRNPASASQGPGTGNFGYVDVIGANLVGSGAGAPTWLPTTGNARACFGVCGPRSPIIHSRENY